MKHEYFCGLCPPFITRLTILCVLCLFFPVTLVASAINASATNVCMVGYVMDTYCIGRGTLLDNKELKTLEHPDKHSVHCLVDVPNCYESGFEILQDPPADESTKTYCRALKLDAGGNAMALSLARALGEYSKDGCYTCTRDKGTLRKVLELQ